MSPRTLLAGGLVAVLALGPLAGCSGDPREAYCETVSSQRTELSTRLSDGGTTALFDALPVMQRLRDEAPDDIRGDWNSLVGAIEGLEQALDDAGVAPATYDRGEPSAGVTDEERAGIDAAARRLGNAATAQASERIQQHARDVCHTPLTL